MITISIFAADAADYWFSFYRISSSSFRRYFAAFSLMIFAAAEFLNIFIDVADFFHWNTIDAHFDADVNISPIEDVAKWLLHLGKYFRQYVYRSRDFSRCRLSFSMITDESIFIDYFFTFHFIFSRW